MSAEEVAQRWEADEARGPYFSISVHFKDEPEFDARILCDREEDPADQPALILRGDYASSLFLTFTDDQLRTIADTIERYLPENGQPEVLRRRRAAVEATSAFSVEALEHIAAKGESVQFALRESIAATRKES